MKHEVNRDVLGDIVYKALSGNFSKSTHFISHSLVAKAKRKMFNGKIDKRSRIAEIVVTVGMPNYSEREYIRRNKKLGDVFPFTIDRKIDD